MRPLHAVSFSFLFIRALSRHHFSHALSVRYPIRRRLDRGIKKKVLRAGCLALLRLPRAANCLLPGLITSLCYSVNARRKPLCLPRLNSRLSYICIYNIYIYTHHLNAPSRTRHRRAIVREREKKPVEISEKTFPDVVR